MGVVRVVAESRHLPVAEQFAAWLAERVSDELRVRIEEGGDRGSTGVRPREADSVDIFICSAETVEQPWLHFEVGWSSGAGVDPILLCLPALDPRSLRPPLSRLRTIDAHNGRQLMQLGEWVTHQLRLPVPSTDWALADLPSLRDGDVRATQGHPPGIIHDEVERTVAVSLGTLPMITIESIASLTGATRGSSEALVGRLEQLKIIEDTYSDGEYKLLVSDPGEIHRRLRGELTFHLMRDRALSFVPNWPNVPGLYVYRSLASAITVFVLLLAFVLVSDAAATRLTSKYRAANKALINGELLTDDAGLSPLFESPPAIQRPRVAVAMKHDFHFGGDLDSDAVRRIRRENEDLNALLGNERYESLFSLVDQLYFLGRNEHVERTLRSWVRNSMSDNSSLSQRDFDAMLKFLEHSYVNTVQESFMAGDYESAAMGARQSATIARLAQPKPALGNPYLYERYNRMLLAEILFFRPSCVYRDRKAAELLLKASQDPDVLSTSDYEKALNGVMDDSCFRYVREYWVGLARFKAADYAAAAEHFRKATGDPGNVALHTSALLMIGRSIFWALHDEKTAAAAVAVNAVTNHRVRDLQTESVKALRTLQDQLRDSAYGDDIAYYISELDEARKHGRQ